MNTQKTVALIFLFLMMSSLALIAGGSQGPGQSTSRSGSGAQPGGNLILTGTNKAYGDNMKEVEPGVFAIYSGDVNQDGYIATDDVTSVDNDNLVGASGPYLVTDLNGDTYTATDDVTLCDNNNLLGIQIMRP